MASFIKLQKFVEALAHQVHDLGSDQIKVALTNTAPDSAADGELADLTEISYTNVSSRDVITSSSGQVAGLYKLVLADLVLMASGAVGPFQYVVLYNDTAADKNLIGYFDFGSAVLLASSDEFTIDFSAASGVLQLQ